MTKEARRTKSERGGPDAAQASTLRASCFVIPSSFDFRHSSFLPPSAFPLLLLLLAGCRPELQDTYGQRKGPLANSSVNGTAVLGEMFERAGHTVFSWRMLSPRLSQRADCIVWFPDDFEPPSDKVRQWLEDWLDERPGRTLIYVGRDFDAVPWYWEEVEPGTPKPQQAEIRSRKVTSNNEFLLDRKKTPDKDCDWFTVESKHRPRPVRTLQGSRPWLQGIDPKKVEIELHGRTVPSQYAEVLLASEGDVLVSSMDVGQGRLIVVANGSFLLNLPLVNHEHRKLAGRLIDEIGPPPQTVVFLESGAGGPMISDKDPSAQIPTGAEIFHEWPASWILLHLAVVGIILCVSRYPIFGLPRSPPPRASSDFGKHIQALGELLRRSGDTAYAMTRLLHYRQRKE